MYASKLAVDFFYCMAYCNALKICVTVIKPVHFLVFLTVFSEVSKVDLDNSGQGVHGNVGGMQELNL